MASFEGVGLTLQIVHNVYGMVGDMRGNAVAYKARLVAGHTVAVVRAVMLADANEYKRRLQWLTDVVGRNLTIVTTALTEQGLTIVQLNTHRTSLGAAADHTLAAALSNAGQINTEADWIIANVPNYERLW